MDNRQSLDVSLESKENLARHAQEEGKKIFAVYEPWYGNESSQWSHWEGFGHKPQNILDKNIASVRHPLIGLYDSSDRTLIQYHIELRKPRAWTDS